MRCGGDGDGAPGVAVIIIAIGIITSNAVEGHRPDVAPCGGAPEVADVTMGWLEFIDTYFPHHVCHPLTPLGGMDGSQGVWSLTD